ncbi:MAG: rhomboid family intramembrane serine protease [Saprospiraceae bacterium]|nr:rhomboid family intramembrane serine protease [Saprospiraceae bacterium]NNK89731.1 rhomboid family intramembrane serine protease [Saprospiraceae bacterium]
MEKSAKKFFSALKFSTFLIVVIWIVHVWTQATGISLSRYGVFPREPDGLIGILTAPLVHGSWEHLISNSAPLFVTATMISFFYKRVAIPSFFFIYLLTGASVWLFGRSVYHIGASGVVYGLVAFIFWSGIFRRNIKSIILALIVIILYSGYLGGILPLKEGISWESHLMGGIVGIIVAYIFKGMIEKDEHKTDPWADEENEEKQYYLPRDTFEKTKLEREMERESDFLSLD